MTVASLSNLVSCNEHVVYVISGQKKSPTDQGRAFRTEEIVFFLQRGQLNVTFLISVGCDPFGQATTKCSTLGRFREARSFSVLQWSHQTFSLIVSPGLWSFYLATQETVAADVVVQHLLLDFAPRILSASFVAKVVLPEPGKPVTRIRISAPSPSAPRCNRG